MIIFYIIGATLALFILAGLLFRLITNFPRRKKEPGFEYVYINKDGSVRELYRDEIEYLETEFHPNDGNRPYIKNRYKQVSLTKDISGFIKRRSVPKHIKIQLVNQEELDNLYKNLK